MVFEAISRPFHFIFHFVQTSLKYMKNISNNTLDNKNIC